jgi:acetyl esterase/lipase
MIYPEVIFAQSGFISNLVYRTVGNLELKLDLVVPRIYLGEDPWWAYDEKKKPTLLYIHGGGMVEGEKETRFLELLPFVARNWVVVNIDYRLKKDWGEERDLAPVIDCREALAWIYNHADEYRMDTTKIVVSGESAGGYLALMTGLLQQGDVIGGSHYRIEPPHRVSAIINWFGVTDILALDPPDSDEQPEERRNIIRSCSPVTHVRPNSPPVFSIHGTADPLIPFTQAEILHNELKAAEVPNKLILIEGKKHGDFSAQERMMIFREIWAFLEANGLPSISE